MNRALARLALAVACALGGPLAHAVTYYERPPSVEELARVFAAPAALRASAGAPGAPLMRGLSWHVAGAAQAAAAAGVAGQAAAATTERPADPLDGGAPAVAVPVTFDVASSQVSPASLAYVAAIAALLERDPALRLQVEGHTDASGDPRRNLMLSWERAFAVFRTLVDRYGVDPARLQPLGRGAAEPLAEAPAGDARQRRVQFRRIG